MATTLEELERRLNRVEEELKLWRPQIEESPAQRGARLLWQARHEAHISALMAKVMQESGVGGEPVGAERLREMILATGVTPENNEFSRSLIEAREE
ncbi:MAG: hypothetical protein U0Z53_09980 [Blastocatellia bacterium]